MTVNAQSQSGFKTLMENIFDAIRLYKSTVGDISLVDISKKARVEPIAIVNRELPTLKEYNSIMNGVLNLYVSYYVQAIQLLDVYYENAKVVKILDSVSPDRSYIYESNKIETLLLDKCHFSFENLYDEDILRSPEDMYDIKDYQFNTDAEYIDRIKALGKVIELSFNIADTDDVKNMKKITIPVAIRLLTHLTEPGVIRNIMSLNKESIKVGSRFKQVVEGRIGFIKDFLFAEDLIKKQKRLMFRDGAEAYNDIIKRYNKGSIFTVLNEGNVGYGKISSIYCITEEDEAFIAREYGVKLSNKSVRDKIFNNSMSMIICVFDREWERITTYVRDTNGYSQNNFSDFKDAKDKNVGEQISEMVKALSAGNVSMI